MDKLIAKVHSSILNIHGLVGEKEARKWLDGTSKSTVASTSKVKTPAKKPRTRTTTAAEAAAAAITGEEPEAGGSGGAGQPPSAEQKLLEGALKLQYTHLIEMDEILREKLFILQVNFH